VIFIDLDGFKHQCVRAVDTVARHYVIASGSDAM